MFIADHIIPILLFLGVNLILAIAVFAYGWEQELTRSNPPTPREQK